MNPCRHGSEMCDICFAADPAPVDDLIQPAPGSEKASHHDLYTQARLDCPPQFIETFLTCIAPIYTDLTAARAEIEQAQSMASKADNLYRENGELIALIAQQHAALVPVNDMLDRDFMGHQIKVSEALAAHDKMMAGKG